MDFERCHVDDLVVHYEYLGYVLPPLGLVFRLRCRLAPVRAVIGFGLGKR